MGHVSMGMNPSPPNGRPRYNLRDYIRQRGLCEWGMGNLNKKEKKETSL